jgi:hypothetical protein
MTSNAIWTTAGLNLVASAAQSSSANAAATYVGLSTGCGTLSVGLSLSVTYTSLSLDAALPVSLAAGQSLVITDGSNSQVVTCDGAQSAGASTLTVVSFLATATYSAHTTGVAPLPLAGDVALYNESVRVPVLAAGAGASAGESLISGYADGTQASGVYMMAGYFGGSSATSSTGTGTLMIADASDETYWNHTINADSNMYQADAVI